MDKYENRVIIITGILLMIFIFAILRAMSKNASDLPACIPYDGAYSEPKVVKLDDSTYQVYMVAQMWNFEPSEIFLPVGAEVDLYLTTKDVVHGFNIPDKSVNMMAVYGGINKTTIKFDEPGVYPIICHEYCGSGHQAMKSEIIVNYPNQ
jgi:cytochrome c oxidase subunit 2